MPGGYTGRILFVNLTEGAISSKSPPEETYRHFIGGTGLGVRILYESMRPGTDPLGPDNVLGFVTGPLTGTSVPGSGRFTVVTKSPLTRAWADSNSGGSWGPALKWAGYDAVFFSGISPKPVYLMISNEKAELKDAAHLWGKDTNETDDLLQKELGESQWRITSIGPAGEACSLLAGIVNEKGRIAARGGVGAVMGSKRLKAVAVRGGKKRIRIADTEKLNSVRKEFTKNIMDSPFHKGLAASGTGGDTSFLVSISDCPTKNWLSTGLDSMPTCEKLNSPNMNKYKQNSYGCHSCPIRCGALIRIDEGPFKTKAKTRRPEYETLAAFGALCLNDSVESVIKANEICNLFGMDTIAVGGVIAFAMECYENGLIDQTETGGIDLVWGSGEAVVALTEQIARREGFGAVLADGVREAAERIGKGAEKYAIHVGGHRMPYHDPRLSPALGTSYIADAQPACHMDVQGTNLLERGDHLGSEPLLQSPGLAVFGEYNKKGPMFATGAEYFQLLSSSGFCALYAIGFAIPVVEFIVPVTGWDLTWEEGLKIGKRILTLRQAFNAREGIKPSAFRLPKRFRTPLTIKPAINEEVDFETLKRCYFAEMGWDINTGQPGRETLINLGLIDLLSDL